MAAGSKNYIIFKTKTMTMKASCCSCFSCSSFSILGLLLMAPKSMQNKQTDRQRDRQTEREDRQTNEHTVSQPVSRRPVQPNYVELSWVGVEYMTFNGANCCRTISLPSCLLACQPACFPPSPLRLAPTRSLCQFASLSVTLGLAEHSFMQSETFLRLDRQNNALLN